MQERNQTEHLKVLMKGENFNLNLLSLPPFLFPSLPLSLIPPSSFCSGLEMELWSCAGYVVPLPLSCIPSIQTRPLQSMKIAFSCKGKLLILFNIHSLNKYIIRVLRHKNGRDIKMSKRKMVLGGTLDLWKEKFL